jgi:acetyltransferase-like isoleucine patch superfamily enzyme
MTTPDAPTAPSGQWLEGTLPANVQLGHGSVLKGEHAFQRFHSQRDPALVIGEHCTMDGVHFALGDSGRIQIGNYCYFCNVILLCELELRIGNYVVAGWNTTIADTDFHPISPAARIQDAIACSPLGQGRPRPPIPTRPVIIEDDVWIGPNVTVLKGVRIGAGAFIEPGALITHEVPPRARVLGNPAQIVGFV